MPIRLQIAITTVLAAVLGHSAIGAFLGEREDGTRLLNDSEHAVGRMKPRPRYFPLQDRQLLAESDYFQPYRLAARGKFAHEGDEDHDDRLHAADGSRPWAKMPGFLPPTRL